jgi:non-ribosomal peptide synthetase component F
VWEIFGPLLAGVRLRVVPQDTVMDVEAFVAALEAAEVTRLVLVPSLLRALLEVADLGQRLPKLKYWVTSGEALSEELAQRFVANLPGRILLNLYGSTEVSADVTYYEASAG